MLIGKAIPTQAKVKVRGELRYPMVGGVLVDWWRGVVMFLPGGREGRKTKEGHRGRTPAKLTPPLPSHSSLTSNTSSSPHPSSSPPLLPPCWRCLNSFPLSADPRALGHACLLCHSSAHPRRSSVAPLHDRSTDRVCVCVGVCMCVCVKTVELSLSFGLKTS